MAEIIINAGAVSDARTARGEALSKAGYQVLTAMTQSEALRLLIEARPNAIVMSRMPGLAHDICLRIKSHAATADIPIIAICAGGNGRHWANHADLRLPETIEAGAVVAIIRILLRAQAVERESLRTQVPATGESTDEHPRIPELEDRLNELDRERERLSRQNQDLREFLPGMAHDLRSSLCSVIVVSSWILSEYGDQLDDSAREYLVLLRQSVDRMRVVVENAWQRANAVDQS